MDYEAITSQIEAEFDDWKADWADKNLGQDYPSDYEQGRLDGFMEAAQIIAKYLDVACE